MTPTRPTDADIREMLEVRAGSLPPAAARDVLAEARAEIAGPVPSAGAMSFRVRPVDGASERSRVPWGIAALAAAIVITVGVLGGRAQLDRSQASVPVAGGPVQPAASTGYQVMGGSITPGELGNRLRTGELDGKTVVVQGRLFLEQGRCRSPEPCMFVRVDGVPEAWIDLGGRSVEETQAAIDRFGQTLPVVLQGANGGLRLVGWLVASLDGPFAPDPAILHGLLGDDPERVVEVLGWLQADNGAVRLTATEDATGNGITVAVDPSFPPSSFEPPWGQFFVRAPDPTSWQVAARAGSARVDVDRPRAELAGQTVAAADLLAAIKDGSWDGKLFAIDGELKSVAWECPLDARPCSRYFVDGLPGVAITWDGGALLSPDVSGSAGSTMTGRLIVTPRHGRLQPQTGYLELLGVLVGGLDRPISIRELAAREPAGSVRDTLQLRAVEGWLVVDGSTSCTSVPSGGTPCPEPRSLLTPAGPDADGRLTSPEVLAVETDNAAPGLAGLPIRQAGPFLVRPSNDASAGWLVVGRYDLDGVRVVTFPEVR